MIYLLGGPPRTGKSVLSAQICRKHGLSAVSTDSLGAALEHVLTPEAEPDLFVFAKFNELPMEERVGLMTGDPNVFLNCAIAESRVIWRCAKAFIAKEQDEGRDVLIEGVAVLPELVAELQNIDYRVVFIGNRGSAHSDNIRQGVRENARDWMGSVSDDYIEAFAGVVRRMSAFLEEEAKRFGFPYFEMDGKPFGGVASTLAQWLGLKAG